MDLLIILLIAKNIEHDNNIDNNDLDDVGIHYNDSNDVDVCTSETYETGEHGDKEEYWAIAMAIWRNVLSENDDDCDHDSDITHSYQLHLENKNHEYSMALLIVNNNDDCNSLATWLENPNTI